MERNWLIAQRLGFMEANKSKSLRRRQEGRDGQGRTPVKVNVNGREDHERRLSQADDAAEDDDEKNTILFPC